MLRQTPDKYGFCVTALPVIFDCDPGKDDAFALFLALALPDVFDVLAVTTVAGNVAVERTSVNARRIVEAAGRPDIPVYAGCERPMLRRLKTATETHGIDGLGGSGLPEPAEGPLETHAVTALIRLLEASDRPVTIVAIGPLTNIATMLIAHPDIASSIGHLAVMGGASGRGNMTARAEFNIHVDPHAAHVALSVASPISLVTLDTTSNLRPPMTWFDAMGDFGRPGAALLGMWRAAPVALYDVAVTGLLAWPDIFTLEEGAVDVVIEDGNQCARTVITPGAGPVQVVTAIDQQTFLDRTAHAMKAFGVAP
ncbi:MAG: nucleoside hydrolase [Rhodospirillales bacterium]|nr:nucleoside hydrolase [Rhodospirillales bacterium]